MSSQFGPPPLAQQQYPPPPIPYDSRPATDDRASSATAGFVFGLIGLLSWILPVLGLPVAIAGLVFSIRGMASRRSTYAIVGVILTSFGLLCSLGMTGAYFYMLATGQFNEL